MSLFRHLQWAESNGMVASSSVSVPESKAEYELRPPPGSVGLDTSAVLTTGAVAFLIALQREFGRARRTLLLSRQTLQSELDAGAVLDFSPVSRALRMDDSWRVPEAPADLVDRRCEITGPTDARMLINALKEKHLLVDGQPVSASLFDAGLYAFHNAVNLVEHLCLPKLQAASEAQLWADVFAFTAQWLRLARGTIRATVLVETLPMAFQMEETLAALGPHAISNRMEDAATAEIARSQVWQWVYAGVFTPDRVRELIDKQTDALAAAGNLAETV